MEFSQQRVESAAFFGEPHLHGLRVGYAAVATARLRQGLEVLAELLRAQLVA